jgi:hypothetical protein
MNATGSPQRPLRWYEYAVALLPFTLAFTGVIGLAIGPAACALSLAAMRSSSSLSVRIAAAIGIALLAIVAWVLATQLLI